MCILSCLSTRLQADIVYRRTDVTGKTYERALSKTEGYCTLTYQLLEALDLKGRTGSCNY